MADKPLFALDAEGRWRLAFDAQQWVVQQRMGRATLGRSGTWPTLHSRWRARHLPRSSASARAHRRLMRGYLVHRPARARLSHAYLVGLAPTAHQEAGPRCPTACLAGAAHVTAPSGTHESLKPH